MGNISLKEAILVLNPDGDERKNHKVTHTECLFYE